MLATLVTVLANPAYAQVVLPCPGTSPTFTGGGAAKIHEKARYPKIVDCDADLDELYRKDPNYARYVDEAAYGTLAQCLQLVAELHNPNPGYDCPLICPLGVCDGGIQSNWSNIGVAYGHPISDPSTPEGYATCEPSLTEVSPGFPNAGCWVDFECDLACEAKVDSKVICGCFETGFCGNPANPPGEPGSTLGTQASGYTPFEHPECEDEATDELSHDTKSGK